MAVLDMELDANCGKCVLDTDDLKAVSGDRVDEVRALDFDGRNGEGEGGEEGEQS